MNRKYPLIQWVLAGLFAFMPGSRAGLAQTCGGPRIPDVSLNTIAAGELDVFFVPGGIRTASDVVNIGGEDISISLWYLEGGSCPVRVSISNTGAAFRGNWGESLRIDANVMVEEALDVSVLAPEYQELWERARALAAELSTHDKFLEFLNGKLGDRSGPYLECFRALAEGRYEPQIVDQFFAVQRTTTVLPVAGGMETLGRGFSVSCHGLVQVLTPDPLGTENPDIYVDVWDGSGNWDLHINPENRTVEVDYYLSPAEEPRTLDDFRVRIDRLCALLEYVLSQVPALESLGVLSSDEGMSELFTMTVEGLRTYTIGLAEELSTSQTSG